MGRAAYLDGSEGHDMSAGERDRLGLAVQPRRGRAVLWFSRLANSSIDFRSRHVGCPVIHGEKWAATRWIHHQLPPCGLAYT